jgi:hypothetical protein
VSALAKRIESIREQAENCERSVRVMALALEGTVDLTQAKDLRDATTLLADEAHRIAHAVSDATIALEKLESELRKKKKGAAE